MEKPEINIIDKVLDNLGTKKEAMLVAKWFATDEGSSYVETRMDEEYSEKEKIQKETTPLFREIHLPKPKSIKKEFGRKEKLSSVWRIAAVLLPFFIFSLFAWYISSRVDLIGTSSLETVTTRKKEKTHLVFQDGTEVFISPETTLKFPKKFGLNKRSVILNGEAYFKVAKNIHKPFLVNMKGSSIKVLGTSFLVKSYDNDDDINILLEEGSIDFKLGHDRSNILKAGQQLKYDKIHDELIIKETSNTDSYDNWRNNIIVFNNNKLEIVLKTLNRWYDQNFIIQDNSIINYTYTTTFQNASLFQILKELEEVSPIHFTYANDTIFVSRKK